jgi:hypothetical protein
MQHMFEDTTGVIKSRNRRCDTNNHGYVPLVVITIRSFHYLQFITSCVPKVTQRVSLVVQ